MAARIKVCILFGGKSGEHEVSLRSAASVVKHLDPARYQVTAIGIDKAGRWHLQRQVESNEVPGQGDVLSSLDTAYSSHGQRGAI